MPVVLEETSAVPLGWMRWTNLLLALSLAAGAFTLSLSGSGRLHPVVYNDPHAKNLLFDSDPARVVETMSDRASPFQRFSSTHPLFGILTYPTVFVLKRLTGLPPLMAVRVTLAGIAAVWASTLFVVLVLIGTRRLDAVLFTLLGLGSAAGMFWLAIPETYALGSATILWAVAVAALAERRSLRDGWFAVVSALSLSVTVTNWMAGIGATIVNRRFPRAIQISVNALAMVVLAWAVQKLLFPASQFFLQPSVSGHFIAAPEAGGPLVVLKAFFLDSVIMPALKVAQGVTPYWYLPVLTVQGSAPGSGSGWGLVGIGAWVSLLAIGVWSLLSLGRARSLRLMLGLTLIGQLALHQVFGTETFLYALNFAPLLILVAALGTQTSARVPALTLAGIVTLSAVINNRAQFHKAAEFVQGRETQAYLVDRARQTRPGDPFPRGLAHVVLGLPGSPDSAKGYHEPGGSFSPAAGSFGVSVWITDSTGHILTTSDDIPPSQVQQRFEWGDPAGIPGIATETPYYRLQWISAGPGRWQLRVAALASENLRRVVLIRSIGPAGGPIRSLDWNGRRLLISDRWSVIPKHAPAGVVLGHEGDPDWKTAHTGPTLWTGNDGWGYARLTLPAGGEWEARLEDGASTGGEELAWSTTRSAVQVRLPDERFAASLDAQVTHLMMGLVGKETRPGDPLSYAGPWPSDEAHIVVALARAGQLEVAKQISRHLAENDFFGGFGPAADTPGLAIGALVEVAALVGDSTYDRWVWQHVRRKAEFILRMRSTGNPIRVSVVGPIAPSRQSDPSLPVVSEGSREGLIIETRDDGLLWRVNNINQDGLLDAADLALRVNERVDATRYQSAAREMRDAWRRAGWASPTDQELHRQPRRFSGRGWLTSLAARGREEARLGAASARKAGALAGAHQGLFAGRLETVWATLLRFWAEQQPAGLFAWSEPSGVDGSHDRWESIRGRVDRQLVTPVYEIAAQVLLLQLDMLAYVDDSGPEPQIVIGAGVAPAWLGDAMSARHLPIPGGSLDWEWDGKSMHVQVRGSRAPVQLGPIFPLGTSLKVRRDRGSTSGSE